MLYNAIIFILILLFAAFTQIMTIKAVKFGIKVTEKPEQAANEPFFHVPKSKKKPKMTDEDKRTSAILANIDRYDGTSAGQVKVTRNGQ